MVDAVRSPVEDYRRLPGQGLRVGIRLPCAGIIRASSLSFVGGRIAGHLLQFRRLIFTAAAWADSIGPFAVAYGARRFAVTMGLCGGGDGPSLIALPSRRAGGLLP